VSNVIIPQVRMTFPYEKDAYEMYNTYVGNTGFNIRKSDIKRVDKSITLKLIVCSNQGSCSARTDCGARILFTVSREGIWTVKNLVCDHNHYLASPNKKCKLRSQRYIIDANTGSWDEAIPSI
jgi:hypothetical protein